jgi:glycosyltransferase involved in cell wall biosynthesis
MNLSQTTLAVYYHMPFIRRDDGSIDCNPVIGTFIESLIPYYKKIFIFGFESVVNPNAASYNIATNTNLVFVSLGPEGRFWDYFSKMKRLRMSVQQYKLKIDILFLRVPSHKAYFIWKYLGEPEQTALLFVGNPYYTDDYSNSAFYMHIFRGFRSHLHDQRMKRMCKNKSALVFANSPALVALWAEILETDVRLLQTSSISSRDILNIGAEARKIVEPLKLLFVGRVCYDKGIRELLEALALLNEQNGDRYFLDIVGPEGDMEGNSIAQLIDKYEVAQVSKFHGMIPFGKQLFQYYRDADVYVLPSYHEGMPHAIWEALSQGTPVISTPVGGIGDYFTDNEDILFISVRDPASIVEVVQKFDKDVSLHAYLIENGLKKVGKVTREAQAETMAVAISKKWQS